MPLAETVGRSVTGTDFRILTLYVQGWVEDDELRDYLDPRHKKKEAPL